MVYHCDDIKINGGEVKYSGMPKLAPWFTGTIDLCCLCFLTFFRMYKITWRTQNRKDKIRTGALILMLFVCLIDICWSMKREVYPYLTNFLRPVVIMIFLSSIRSNMKSVMRDFYDSLAVLIIIFSFIGFFAFAGLFLFEGSFEGVLYFPTLGNAFYELTILMTTSNYPNIMLPAYNAHRYNCLFFMLFLTIGLYFFLNILLAIVFDNYKAHITTKVEQKNQRRIDLIEPFYRCYD